MIFGHLPGGLWWSAPGTRLTATAGSQGCMAARDIKENNEKVDNSDGWYKDHKSATSIGEGSGLNMWIEEIEENKLCQSGISKLATIKYVCVCVCV
jgi:hypothetical protein